MAQPQILVTSSPSDIYAIGVGKLDVDWRELNELASKKDGERHAFILQDAKALHQVFEHMLGECLPSPPGRGSGVGGEPGAGRSLGEGDGGGWEPAHSALPCLLPHPLLTPQMSPSS